MTREEAIEYLEEFQREIDELYPDADGNGKAILDKQREPIALAISAIRDLDAQENAKTPCDLCCYNPPSSRDGKPCTMCPASPVERYGEESKMSEWISVKDRLPEPEQEVLICTVKMYRGKAYKGITTAMYEDGTIFTEDSVWNWSDIEYLGDYDEERDDWKISSGWWEERHYNPDDVYNNVVDDEVTHWMPLPEPPKEEHHAE